MVSYTRRMFLDFSDTRVHVEQSGRGEALLLLHGFTDSGCNWLPLVAVLEETHLVIRPDARGHGLSARLDRDFTLDDLAADVIGVLDGLGIAKAALLGHSMGASTAARGLRCPATLITGDPERGAIVTPTIAQEAEALCQTIATVFIAGAGHNIRREKGIAYLDAVRSGLNLGSE